VVTLEVVLEEHTELKIPVAVVVDQLVLDQVNLELECLVLVVQEL